MCGTNQALIPPTVFVAPRGSQQFQSGGCGLGSGEMQCSPYTIGDLGALALRIFKI